MLDKEQTPHSKSLLQLYAGLTGVSSRGLAKREEIDRK